MSQYIELTGTCQIGACLFDISDQVMIIEPGNYLSVCSQHYQAIMAITGLSGELKMGADYWEAERNAVVAEDDQLIELGQGQDG